MDGDFAPRATGTSFDATRIECAGGRCSNSSALSNRIPHINFASNGDSDARPPCNCAAEAYPHPSNGNPAVADADTYVYTTAFAALGI